MTDTQEELDALLWCITRLEHLALARAHGATDRNDAKRYTERAWRLAAAIEDELERLREATAWRPIETAPKGNGDQCELVTDPEYIEPPKILMLFESGDQCVVRWDWYYAEGGYGHHKAQDGPAWIIHGGSNLAHLEFGNPVAWRFIGPLPEDI